MTIQKQKQIYADELNRVRRQLASNIVNKETDGLRKCVVERLDLVFDKGFGTMKAYLACASANDVPTDKAVELLDALGLKYTIGKVSDYANDEGTLVCKTEAFITVNLPKGGYA